MVLERRNTSRRVVALDCSLSRAKGGTIPCRTIDLSDGGMRISTARPLTIDEVLSFDLVLGEQEMHGNCRVLRQTAHDSYAVALRADRLSRRRYASTLMVLNDGSLAPCRRAPAVVSERR